MEYCAGKEGVEIGTYCGYTALNILQTVKHLVIVDNWQQHCHGPADAAAAGLPTVCDVMKQFFHQCSLYDLTQNTFEIMKMSSVEAAALCEHRQFDFVWIDGSHLYSDVIQDIHSWVRLIKDGGVILGHDYSDNGVIRAVNFLFGEPQRPAGTVWLVPISIESRERVWLASDQELKRIVTNGSH
jgi:hypothetical protein